MRKLGGFYIIALIGFSQIVTSIIGLGIAVVTIQINAGFTPSQLSKLTLFAGAVLLIRDILLMAGAYPTNRQLITRLNKWSRAGSLEPGGSDENRAWKQIVLLPWRYIIVAFLSFVFLSLLPIVGYLNYVMKGTIDQAIYTFLGGLASGMVVELVEVLLIERMLASGREILLPAGHEGQLSGVSGSRMLVKFLVIVLALIIVSVLFVVPIGYHQTVTVLYEEIGSTKVLTDLQVQSLLVSAVVLIVGLGLSFFLARSISTPVGQIVKVFQKVEQGDLKQRVPVTATDEVGELAVYFNRMITRLDELQSNLEKRVAERTDELRSTLEVGRIASGILDTDELISKVVNLITDRFGYYYAAIFTIDDTNHWAELRDATGAAGATLKSRGHRLELGGVSMVSNAITTRQPHIAQNVGLETVRFDNPLLPETRSEIALPLMVGNSVIGAMDVQSSKEAAFGSDQVDILQGMANQVAIALENARLFQEMNANLEELKATHRLYVTDAWSETAKSHGGYEFVEGSGPETDQEASVSVPLSLREQIIGQLQLDSQEAWTAEERNLIEAVAAQASLALENARLLEESQQLALRERLTAEITGKIWSSQNMDTILQTAIKELGRALRADEATIELEID